MTTNDNVELVTVTPAIAEEWLLRNIHNRRLRWRAVQAYASDMKNGDWQWNGESIKFAEDGTLLDGQNRLYAVIEADMPIPLLVVRGLPNSTQDTMDGGAKRKFADVLQLRGEKHHITLAAVTRRATIWEAGARKSGANFAPTNAQMFQTLEKYPWLRDVAFSAEATSRTCALPGSIIGLGWWLFAQLDDEDTEFFFARLADGQGLVKGDPVYELRRTAESSRGVRGQRSETFLTAILIKAWNAYRDGAQMGQLKYRPGGANPEKFPEPR